MSFQASIERYIDGLVHPAAHRDSAARAQHRTFMVSRLTGGLAGLAAVPLYLALRGSPGWFELGAIGWLIAPLALAFFLSRTGRFETAQAMSVLATCALFAGALCAAVASDVMPLKLLAAGIAASCVLSLAGNARELAKSAQGHREDEHARYDLIAGNIGDMITRHRGNGDVLFASPAATTLLGIAADTLTGHGLFDRVHVHDRPAYLGALDAAGTRGETQTVEFRLRRERSDAHFAWVEMRCRPLESGEVVAVTRDITERKAQEQTLRDAQADAERANAGKARFLATMSHELRTPLNAIIGFSDMMTNEGIVLDEARHREYAKLINESGRHLLSVVNGILDMSKMETGNFEITPEPFAPGQVITGCCDLLALKARDAGVALSVKVPNLPDIVGDRRALSQILINLVSNAIKFTDRGGDVAVAAMRDGHHMTVTVADTGVGIGEEDLRRLGEAFFQARASYDRRHDGTGLGLSIVKGLVRLHGGTFAVQSRLGEGTLVTVRLPIDCEGKRPPAETILLERKPEAVVSAAMPARKSA